MAISRTRISLGVLVGVLLLILLLPLLARL